LLRGTIETTHLRNDGYDFLGLGYGLERADNTARLIDVKYYVLLPRVDYVGSEFDNYQWTTLLRAMSAHRAFHWAYGGDVTPAKIADFLILNAKFPRSLMASALAVERHLGHLEETYGRRTEAQEAAEGLRDALRGLSVEEIIEEGMHEFLSRVIGQVNRIGGIVHDTYLSGEMR